MVILWETLAAYDQIDRRFVFMKNTPKGCLPLPHVYDYFFSKHLLLNSLANQRQITLIGASMNWGTNFFSRHLCHNTHMSTMPIIYGKNP